MRRFKSDAPFYRSQRQTRLYHICSTRSRLGQQDYVMLENVTWRTHRFIPMTMQGDPHIVTL